MGFHAAIHRIDVIREMARKEGDLMADIDWLIGRERLRAAPQGPEVGAFFDLMARSSGYSATAFFRERIKTRDIDAKEVFDTLIESVNIERRGKDVTGPYEYCCPRAARQDLRGTAGLCASESSTRRSRSMYPDARVLVEAHRAAAGHTIVLASSATLPQVQSAAEDLGIDYIVRRT